MIQLDIDLGALIRNFNQLKGLTSASCSCVVKANAYGLGVEAVAAALHKDGCSFFWVATLSEGIQLRQTFPDVIIAVLQGFCDHDMSSFIDHRLTPVLSTPGQIETFRKTDLHDCVIQVETGLNRLGLTLDDLSSYHSLNPLVVMSHLACADAPAHFMNDVQHQAFEKVRALFPNSIHCLSASDGVFLDDRFQCDMVRLGAALYGVNTTPYRENQMEAVVSLKASVLQIKEMSQGEYVGYGATYRSHKPKRIATISIGYADGLPRSLSNRGRLWFQGLELPILGRVSMDMVTCDISNVPKGHLAEGDSVEVLNSTYTVDDLAHDADTIGYEILTRIGSRVSKTYL